MPTTTILPSGWTTKDRRDGDIRDELDAVVTEARIEARPLRPPVS